MCGIAGLVQQEGTRIEPALVKRVQERLRHRGPDDEGFLTFHDGAVETGRVWGGEERAAEVLLLHRRLSIIDTGPAGWQPMVSPDGRYHIVYNGEVYNFVELREELKTRGHRFRSHCDTEVLLAGYAEWGADVLPRLVGMFAFAVLDTQRRTLFLARDFFGIKPLYHARTGRGFAFASEIKVLLEFPGVDRSANPDRLAEYLAHGLCDSGSATMLEAVRQLPAAHYVEVDLDRPGDWVPVRYWSIETEPRTDLSFEAAAAQLRELFLDSVRLHLRSDVPVGAALSGGIDSSAIVAAMREVGGPSLEIHAFSFIADDPALSEERWVDMVGASAGARVHKVHAEPNQLQADLHHLVDVQDEPFGSTSIYAQHRVFQAAARSGIKVMLDGQGADEMLAGYRPHAVARLASLIGSGRMRAARDLWNATPHLRTRPQLRRELLGYLLPSGFWRLARRARPASQLPSWLNGTWFEERGVSLARTEPGFGRHKLRETLRRALTETSLPALLRYEDRNSMAFSIESRVPFLTPALVIFVQSLPEEYLLGPDGTSKAVFRKAMRGLVPDAILDRRDKIGFATPQQDWLTTLRPWAGALLGEGVALPAPLASAGVAGEWNGGASDTFRSAHWRMLNLELWSRRVGVSFE